MRSGGFPVCTDVGAGIARCTEPAWVLACVRSVALAHAVLQSGVLLMQLQCVASARNTSMKRGYM